MKGVKPLASPVDLHDAGRHRRAQNSLGVTGKNLVNLIHLCLAVVRNFRILVVLGSTIWGDRIFSDVSGEYSPLAMERRSGLARPLA